MYELFESATTRLALAGGWWSFGAILAAVVAGAVHAFAPGHGKALAAGYFASPGSSRADAARYAVTAAGMHTASALLVGIGLFGFAAALSPEGVVALRAAAAGAMVLAGLGMLRRACRGRRHGTSEGRALTDMVIAAAGDPRMLLHVPR